MNMRLSVNSCRTMKILSERLLAARTLKGWTQEDLSRRTRPRISQGLISKYEREEADPTAENLTALCQALDISPNWALGWPTDRHLSDEAISILEALRRLPHDESRRLRDAIHLLLRIEGPETDQPPLE